MRKLSQSKKTDKGGTNTRKNIPAPAKGVKGGNGIGRNSKVNPQGNNANKKDSQTKLKGDSKRKQTQEMMEKARVHFSSEIEKMNHAIKENNFELCEKTGAYILKEMNRSEDSQLGAKDTKELLGDTYTSLGNMYAEMGNMEDAIQNYTSAMEIKEARNLKSALIEVCKSQGEMKFGEGDYHKAMEIWSHAARRCQNDKDKSWLLLHIAKCHHNMDDVEKKRTYAYAAMTASRNTDDLDLQLSSTLMLIDANEKLMDYRKALNLCDVALQLAIQKGDENMKYNINTTKERLHEILNGPEGKLAEKRLELTRRKQYFTIILYLYCTCTEIIA